jgi:hypothetical protein
MDRGKNCVASETAPAVFMTLPEAHKKFREYFPGLRFNDYTDALLSVVYGGPKIDIGKFDDYLHDSYGDYENGGLNMEGLIAKIYGDRAARFIRELI